MKPKPIEKVLFLDCDGVICRDGGWVGPGSIDPTRLSRLLRVLAATGARVVLSSTWRVSSEVQAQMKAEGVPIWSTTPRIDSAHRGDEITAWLIGHPGLRRFAIVDDDPDAGDGRGLADRFVQTTWEKGLEEAHVVWLIEILNG